MAESAGTDWAALKQALVLGLARRPFADSDGIPILSRVALLSARQRFERPQPAGLVTAQTSLLERDQLVSQPVRERLRRLFGAGRTGISDVAGRRVWRALAARELRPHPFDYAVLSSWLRLGGPLVGAHARAWLTARAGLEPADGADVYGITSANWREHGLRERTDFIRLLRRDEPDQARALVEACLPDEPAATRARLLSALEFNLTSNDESLLTTLLEDRAKSVVTLATSLLAQLPGTAAFEARLELAAETLKVETKGLLRRTTTLSIDAPARADELTRWRFVRERFEGIDPMALAGAKALPLDVFTKGATDRHLRAVLFLTAVRDGASQLATSLSDEFSTDTLECLLAEPGTLLNGLDRPGACQAMDALANFSDITRGLAVTARLSAVLEVPLGRARSEGLLASRAMRKWLAETEADSDEDALLELTALLAHGTHPALIAQLSDQPAALTGKAQTLAELLALLDEAET